MGIRLSLLMSVTALVFSGLLFHLYQLQVEEGEYYLAQAQEHSQFDILGSERRGDIFFTEKGGDRVSAATDKDFPEIYAVPRDIEDAPEVANTIASIVNYPLEDLVVDLSDSDDVYVRLVSKATPRQAQRIEDLNIPGVKVRPVPDRSYPFGSLAAHVLGFVGPNNQDAGKSGKYGVELEYNKELQKIGRKGSREGIALTIEPTVQAEAESILSELVSSYNAKAGSVIVQESDTGKILALANVPEFDPNNYSKFSISNFLNPVVQKRYEPGSVFKAITMASAIDAGAVTPNTSFYDSGELIIGNHTIHNWDLKGHGRVTMTNVLEQSINTGAAFAARQLGEDSQEGYLRDFGFAAPTGIDLPGELAGDISNLEEGSSPLNFATASFGQGVAVTPIEVVNAFSAIANGGTLMRPYVRESRGPQEIRRVVSEEAARQTTGMLVSAVDNAQVAKIEGYAVAGKTGTAQVPDLQSGGYTNQVVNTYVGFAPASVSPRGGSAEFTILFKLDEPEGAPLAGLTVVPAFRDLAQFMLNYYQIPPNRVTVTE